MTKFEKIEILFDSIDSKFENMSEEELEEYEIKTELQIKKYGGKRLDQMKKYGYLSLN